MVVAADKNLHNLVVSSSDDFPHPHPSGLSDPHFMLPNEMVRIYELFPTEVDHLDSNAGI